MKTIERRTLNVPTCCCGTDKYDLPREEYGDPVFSIVAKCPVCGVETLLFYDRELAGQIKDAEIDELKKAYNVVAGKIKELKEFHSTTTLVGSNEMVYNRRDWNSKESEIECRKLESELEEIGYQLDGMEE